MILYKYIYIWLIRAEKTGGRGGIRYQYNTVKVGGGFHRGTLASARDGGRACFCGRNLKSGSELNRIRSVTGVIADEGGGGGGGGYFHPGCTYIVLYEMKLYTHTRARARITTPRKRDRFLNFFLLFRFFFHPDR